MSVDKGRVSDKVTSRADMMPIVSRTSTLEYDWNLAPPLKRLLQCPICTRTAIPPIFICPQSHIVCHLCKEATKVCPLCSSEYTGIRNGLAEAILDNCTFRCIYDKCGEVLGGGDMAGHLEVCGLRPIPCPIPTAKGSPCGQLLNYTDHVSHMHKDHALVGVDGASAVIAMSASVSFGQGTWTFPPHFMRAFGQMFWCNFHASSNIIIAWVSFSGIDKDMVNYASAVIVFDPYRKWHQSKWIGPLHSVRSTPEEVFKSGNCLALLPESFLRFTRVHVENGRKIKSWHCHFEIMKVDEEVTFGGMDKE